MEFFIDSNIVIETFKENYNREAFKILDTLLSLISKGSHINCYINSIVESEVVFQLIFKGKSSLSREKLRSVLLVFEFLEIGEDVRDLFWKYLEKYNLRPNDALILSTCKHYNITCLISLDSDFQEACEKEDIILIDSPEKLQEILRNRGRFR